MIIFLIYKKFKSIKSLKCSLKNILDFCYQAVNFWIIFLDFDLNFSYNIKSERKIGRKLVVSRGPNLKRETTAMDK